MKITALWVGKGRDRWADEACQEYTRRLPRHLDYVDQRLDPIPFKGNKATVQKKEARRILDALASGDRLIALDERGKALDSHAFAALIDEAARMGTKRMVFALGGPYGHGAEVRDRAWKTIRLSTLVLNHAVARVVLSEQLYRASTLLWGGNYHH